MNTEYDSPMNPLMMLQDRAIDPFATDDWRPRTDEIITALPNINRYNGHTRFPYSVAQHSILCTRIAASNYKLNKPHQRLFFLLHDGAEAYLQDIIRPIKKFSTALNASYMQAENEITENIMYMMMPSHHVEEVLSDDFQSMAKEIDTRMAVTEVEQLMPKHQNPIPPWTPYDLIIKERSAGDVRREFTDAIIANLIDNRDHR